MLAPDREVFVSTRVDLPLTLDRQWRTYARKHDVTLSSVLRLALRQYLDDAAAA